ncbi:MAG TPA: hypothetical protein VI585_03260 [Candidatus Binatia bacterium]
MTETAIARTLSAQEEAIQSGRKTVHGTATDRVLRLYEAIRPYQPPPVTLERAVMLTESFKETEGSRSCSGERRR